MAVLGWVLALLVTLTLLLAGYLLVKDFLGKGKVDQSAPVPPAEEKRETVPPAPEKPPRADDKRKAKAPKSDTLSSDEAKDGTRIAICPGFTARTAPLSPDGRFFGHFPYVQVPADQLSAPPAGFANGSCTALHGEAKAALDQMLTAARDSAPEVADTIVGLSCFRSTTYQRKVFCRKIAAGFDVRAKSSAPPGFSEHATGYAIDFGDRSRPECDLNACFADTPVGRWLQDNAGTYGFVMSFPDGNSQGVTYEPWHWRFEGTDGAKSVFAPAKT